MDTPIEPFGLEKETSGGLENDVSFILDGKLIIVAEHQSSINNNMPVRFLGYIGALYKKYLGKQVYADAVQVLPSPEFYVLYNGSHIWNKKGLELSDAFGGRSGFLDLRVNVIDIKPDTKDIALSDNQELYVYSVLVDKTEKYRKSGMPTLHALEKARGYCISAGLRSGILANWEELILMFNHDFDICAEHEYRGEIKCKRKVALNFLRMGLTVEQAAEAAELSLAEVEQLNSLNRSVTAR